MKSSTIKKLIISTLALSAFTISSAMYFSSNHKITSAVFNDKVNETLGFETNGLVTASISEAWEADKSRVASFKFMQCSVSQPEFTFVSTCHKAKNGKTDMNAESISSIESYTKLYNELKGQQVNRNMLNVLHITGLIKTESLKRVGFNKQE